MTVRVHDGKDAAGDNSTATDALRYVTITVTNVNEPPVITPTGITATFVENSPASTTIKAFAATDVDEDSVLSWSVESADDGGLFEINSNGELTFKTSPDFEMPADSGGDNVYAVTVKVTDDGIPGMSTPTASDTLTINVTVTNVNEAPLIATTNQDAPTFDENATGVVATYVATDVDANSNLTWSLEGNDAGDFTITKTADGDGEVRFGSPPNYERPADTGQDNTYDITVKVTDNHNPQLSDTLGVAVSVADVNERPVVTGNATQEFDEIEYDVLDTSLSVTDYVVSPNSATDDDGDTVAWSLSGDDAEHFVISQTGTLLFDIRPDFENPVDMGGNNVYEIVVEADDQQGEANSVGTHAITVTVNPVDETPEFTGGGEALDFLEIEWDATGPDLTIETYTARDEEGDDITWSVFAGIDFVDSGDFLISSTAGVLSFGAPPNYEMPTDRAGALSFIRDNEYVLAVMIEDPAGNSRTLPVTVTVLNVDETPEITANYPNITYQEVEYDSGLTAADILGTQTFTARDEEEQEITWSLAGEDADDFTITEDADGGALSASSPHPTMRTPRTSLGTTSTKSSYRRPIPPRPPPTPEPGRLASTSRRSTSGRSSRGRSRRASATTRTRRWRWPTTPPATRRAA